MQLKPGRDCVSVGPYVVVLVKAMMSMMISMMSISSSCLRFVNNEHVLVVFVPGVDKRNDGVVDHFLRVYAVEEEAVYYNIQDGQAEK